MRALNFILIISAVVILTCIVSYASELKTVRVELNSTPGFIGYVPDEIIVRFADKVVSGLDKDAMNRGETGISRLDLIGKKHNASLIRQQFPDAKPKTVNGKQIDLSGWHKISFETDVDIDAVIEEYKADPRVLDAEPIAIHALYATPNDSKFSSQWHMDQDTGIDIDGPEAWDWETGNEDIIVAVLDSGVRYYHKDLGGSVASYTNKTNISGNMWINDAEQDGTSGVDDDENGYTDDWIGWDFVSSATQCWSGEDCDTEDNDPADFNGHGTHCAGNIAAITNNNYGVAGVAGGWGSGTLTASADGVRIMPLRIGWSGAYGSLEIGYVRMDFAAEALIYAADNGAKIASCSWGSSNTGGLKAGVEYFQASGGIIIKAAGNDGEATEDYMCGLDDVICVGATDENDCKADFSNYGSWIDISAPGIDILSTYHYHSVPSTDYLATMSGTSMSAPLTAGVAALIWSANPDWTNDLVINKILNSADPIDELACNVDYSGMLGSGRINAYNALYMDSDDDGVSDLEDVCPYDDNKTEEGVCGCGIEDNDTDSDGLLDCEEDEYGTDPDLPDTDDDGIDDGDELAYWGEAWNEDADSDGIINLIDYDSDNDGYSDGIEIEGGYDPSDSGSCPQSVPASTGPVLLSILILLALVGAEATRRKRPD